MRHSASKRPPRARNGVGRRGAILRSAERIFAEVGLAGARTDAIASEARVNKALLYYYFKSKEGLYRAVLEDHLKEFRRLALEVLSADGSSRAVLVRYVNTHFDFISARPYYPRLVHRLIMTGGRPLERMAREYFAPLYRKLGEVVERGMRNGEFRRVDSHHAVLSLVSLIVFYFTSAPVLKLVTNIDPYEKVHLARRKEQVLAFIRHALFCRPEAREP